MKRKLLFIFNPNSGKGKIKNFLYEIIDRFTTEDYEVTVYPTKKTGDCRDKISSSANMYNLVVVSGGDGTINEAVTGMLELPKAQRVPMGYIPSGTINDFASTNNIPPSPLDAVEQIINNVYVSYDIGCFNDKNFIYVAAFGAFADVPYETPQHNKNILGATAYFLEGIKSLPKIKGIGVDILTDTGDHVNTEAYLVLIMNSTSVAGIGFGNFYDINTNDGQFEIVIVSYSINLIDLTKNINKIKSGSTDLQGIQIVKAANATIRTSEPVKWTLDGEYGGETDTVTFKVEHNAVDFVINKNK